MPDLIEIANTGVPAIVAYYTMSAVQDAIKNIADASSDIICDGLRAYKHRNAGKFSEKVQRHESREEQIHPRITCEVINEAIKTDDDTLQEMWAGLLAASAQERPSDDNMPFVSILRNLGPAQARLINYVCDNLCWRSDDQCRLVTVKH